MLIDIADEDYILAPFSGGVCAPTVTLGIFWRVISNRLDLDKMMLKLGLPLTYFAQSSRQIRINDHDVSAD